MPGIVVGMYSSVPSSSGGMNSEPRWVNTGTVTMTSAAAAPMTAHFHRNDQWTTGSYIRIRTRLSGCASSERIRPTSSPLITRQSQTGRNAKGRTRVSSTRSAGSSVITRMAATSIVSVFV
jgi:hypothetical protein